MSETGEEAAREYLTRKDVNELLRKLQQLGEIPTDIHPDHLNRRSLTNRIIQTIQKQGLPFSNAYSIPPPPQQNATIPGYPTFL